MHKKLIFLIALVAVIMIGMSGCIHQQQHTI